MNLILMIGLRNLFRQKKRNILLGISIAFGVMILVTANSFSHGISDVMFNRVMRYVAGQVSITAFEKNMIGCQIFRDKNRLMDIVNHNGQGITRTDEAVGTVCRAIGNGKSENVVVIGLDARQKVTAKTLKEFEESFKTVEGSFAELKNAKIENPAVISTDRARDLNVKVNDIIRIRYKNVFGQDQAARLTVVGVMKITNIFMSGVIFVELQNVKELLGYEPWEVGGLNFTVKDPKRNATQIADRLHDALKPGTAEIVASLSFKEKHAQASVFGFFNNDEIKKKISGHVAFFPLFGKDSLGKKGFLVAADLANKLGVATGDKVELSYENKFGNKTTKVKYEVTAIIQPKNCLSPNTVLMNENIFYPLFYENLPPDPVKSPNAYIPQKSDPLYAVLAPEWILLPRTRTTDDFQKKLHQLTSKKWKAAVVDVATMYESASDILKFESALNIITLVAVLILFFIIVVGVVNTLRMTIRERTREIGTMRAIGMQQRDVRNAFLLEIMFLTFFASLVGIAMAFAAMWGVSRLSFDVIDNPLGMLLVDSHIYFLPTALGIFFNVMLIMVIAFITAYFPARRAAALKAAEALRHYE
jgi:ABC-type lipoprotein release transport system permease subunit